jgi:two-component system, chemotaxis family, chemotaxis protein CheY
VQALVVDDFAAIRRQLTDILSPFASCEAVGDGTAAMKAVGERLRRGERYDLVCLDVGMPGGDGFEVLKEIRRLEAQHGVQPSEQSRIVMVTGLDESQVWVRARCEGCSGYLTKPIHRAFLVRLLVDLGLIAGSSAGSVPRPDGNAMLRALEASVRSLESSLGMPASEALGAFIEKSSQVMSGIAACLDTHELVMVSRHARELQEACARVGAAEIGALCGPVCAAAAARDYSSARTAALELERAVDALSASYDGSFMGGNIGAMLGGRAFT